MAHNSDHVENIDTDLDKDVFLRYLAIIKHHITHNPIRESDSIDPIIQSLLIKNSVIIWPWNNSIKI